ncbi:hypothetical protein C6502_22470 [Candidatus Poribacteria bacterium]|nr:MAG: hypothetical protein C6502_22470 [Candidatus Poribacteria bacterium]
MHRLLRTTILITFGLLIICIIRGCADDAPIEDVMALSPLEGVAAAESAPPAHAVKVFPNPCIPVFPDTRFTLTFDAGVEAARVNDTPATGAGRDWELMPGLEVGTARLNIEWFNRDGTRGTTTIGPYVVLAAPEVLESPTITRGTVRNGEVDVNPAPINASGFLFVFDERVIGAIKLTDEACADLNWTGTVDDRTAALTPVAGQELANNTVYKIEIDVQDGGGNRFRATITFVTKPK